MNYILRPYMPNPHAVNPQQNKTFTELFKTTITSTKVKQHLCSLLKHKTHSFLYTTDQYKNQLRIYTYTLTIHPTNTRTQLSQVYSKLHQALYATNKHTNPLNIQRVVQNRTPMTQIKSTVELTILQDVL